MKNYIYYLSLTLLFTFLTFYSIAQNTYTWNVSNGVWTSASSWSPARTTPASNDILIFNGSIIPFDTVTGFAKDAAGRLRIINNAQVIIQSSIPTIGTGTVTRVSASTTVSGTSTLFTTEMVVGDGMYTGSGSNIVDVQAIASDLSFTCSTTGTAYTGVAYSIMPRLTLSGGVNPSLEILNGSTLTCSGNAINCVTIYLNTGAKASIKGNINYTNGRHRIIANDSNAVVFTAGGTLNISGGYNGSPFSLVGNRNVTTFDSGSVFLTSAAVTPFGLNPPDSKALFAHSSTYRHESTSLPTNIFNGRTFDLFVLNSSAFNNIAVPITLGCTIDTLQILSATELGFNATTAGALNILGAILVNNGTLSIGTGTAAQNLNFSGTTGMQIIGGAGGNINMGNNSIVNINNPAGIRIDRPSLTIAKSLVMTQGNINLNSDTLVLGNASNTGNLTYYSGNIVGPGVFTRWMGNSIIPVGSDTGRFPMGTATANRSLWIAGTPTTAGTVSVSHNDVAGNSTFGTPFSDNATNAVSVNVRQNSNWVVSTANSFAGTGLSLRVQGTGTATQVTNTTNLRLTLATSVAPGTAADGGGTSLLPQANRTGLTAANLSNTFYIGGNATQNPLPINLINFNAINTSPSVTLVWQSSKELNADKYEVEKSINGLSFETISSIKAKGNASIENNYSFVDEDAFKNNNIVYYRLKMIDMNSSVKYSSVVPVKKSDVINTINIVNVTPNPSIKEININIFATNAQQSKVEIIDIRGTVIYSAEKTLIKGDNTFNLDTNFMSAGIYFIRLTGDKEVKHFRIIKN